MLSECTCTKTPGSIDMKQHLQALVSRVHSGARTPGLDLVFPPRAIDFEDRPYHLGWVLHAWPQHRVRRWKGSVVGQ